MKAMNITDPYGFIYITTNNIDGMKYIGQKMFRKDWKSYIGSGIRLINAIKKYGKENFIREIIAIANSKEELNNLEIEYINIHNAVNSEDYYNIVGGGGVQTGFHFSEESKKKISKASTGRNIGKKSSMYGKKHTEETKKKMSESKKGKEHERKFTPQQVIEIREKFSTGKYFQYELAEEYFTTQTTICNIVKGVYKSKLSELYTKFTEQQAIEIRDKYSTGKYTQTELAKEYSVSVSVICNVIHFKSAYKSLSEESKNHVIEPKFKFTPRQAIEIRNKYATKNYKQIELAKEYNCSNSIISNIINFKGPYKQSA